MGRRIFLLGVKGVSEGVRRGDGNRQTNTHLKAWRWSVDHLCHVLGCSPSQGGQTAGGVARGWRRGEGGCDDAVGFKVSLHASTRCLLLLDHHAPSVIHSHSLTLICTLTFALTRRLITLTTPTHSLTLTGTLNTLTIPTHSHTLICTHIHSHALTYTHI